MVEGDFTSYGLSPILFPFFPLSLEHVSLFQEEGKDDSPGMANRHHQTYDQFFTYGISSFHTIFRYLGILLFFRVSLTSFCFTPSLFSFWEKKKSFSKKRFLYSTYILFLSCAFISSSTPKPCRTRHKGRSGATVYFRQLSGELLLQ